MKKFRFRRSWAVVATVAVTAGLAPLVLAAPAGAATQATVHNDAEFFDAWTDSGVTQIDLANDIDLTQYGNCGYYPERNQTDPTLVDGHGFTLTQTCDGNSTVYVDTGTALLTVQNITITHAGAPNPTVFGNGVASSQGPVTVLNSTITGNWTNGCGSNIGSIGATSLCASSGGGIYADGDVIVDGSTISNNQAWDGGGGIFTGGFLTVTNSTVTGNVVEPGESPFALGGGAYANDGATITGSTFTDNHAQCKGECLPAGGGLFSEFGDVTVAGTSVTGNSATCSFGCSNVGGGLAVSGGSLTLTSSSVTNNDASCVDSCQADGGGIFASLSFFVDSAGAQGFPGRDVKAAGRGVQTTITDSTIAGNTATTTDTPGGDCDCSGGGAAFDGQEAVLITRSTFAGNTALYDGGAFDVWNESTEVRLENSTVTGNSSSYDGAIDAWDSPVTTVYSTIDGNILTEPPVEPLASSSGYGRRQQVHAAIAERPANLSAASLTTFATVFADPNGGTNCILTGSGTTSQGYNFSDDASCGLTGTGDRENAGSPQLNALGANGGPTPTMLPYTPKTNGVASPLIDGVPTAACQTGAASGVGTDQRGVTRPQLNGCDIGAVEVTGAEYQVEAAVVIQPRFTG